MSSRKIKKSVIALIPIIYLCITPGAFGAEDLISEVGPGMALSSLIIIPLIYSLPMGLISAELASTYPTDGGMYQWCNNILGEKAGFVCGWCYTLCGFIEPGLFMVLGVNYIKAFLPFELTDFQTWLICIGMVALCAIINILGVQAISNISTITTVLILLVFVTVSILGIINWQYNPVKPLTVDESSIISSASAGLLLTIWLNTGYETIGTMTGEFEDGHKIVPKAIILTVPLVSIGYIVFTMFPLAGVGHWEQWGNEGPISYVEISMALGGPILGVIMMLSAVIGNFTQGCNYLGSYSRVPFVMSENGWFFENFAKMHKKYNTPYISIIVTAIISGICCYSSFSNLVNLVMVVYAAPVLLTLIAIVKLRFTNPDKKSEYKIPVKGPLFAVFVAIPFIVYVYATLADGIFPGIFVILTAIPAYIYFAHRKKVDCI